MVTLTPGLPSWRILFQSGKRALRCLLALPPWTKSLNISPLIFILESKHKAAFLPGTWAIFAWPEGTVPSCASPLHSLITADKLEKEDTLTNVTVRSLIHGINYILIVSLTCLFWFVSQSAHLWNSALNSDFFFFLQITAQTVPPLQSPGLSAC